MAINKVLKVDGSVDNWTSKHISKLIDKGELLFDNEVQRAEVWETWRMSELVWSILMNYPIPPIFCELSSADNGKVRAYDCLDGKQRCTTIYKFLNDQFALTELKPIPYLDDNGEEHTVNISGMKFSELDAELQDIITDSTIGVHYYDNLSQPIKADIFRKLNQGKALSSKTRTLASAKNIGGLLDIGSHELFQEMLSDRARANKNQAVIVAKALTMLREEPVNISFASKDFNPQIEDMDISEEDKLELIEVFDYIVAVHKELVENQQKKEAKKLYTEIHLISLMPFVKMAIKQGISEAMFAEFWLNFYRTDNDTEAFKKYRNASNSGVAKNANIMYRHEALEESFAEFFKEDSVGDDNGVGGNEKADANTVKTAENDDVNSAEEELTEELAENSEEESEVLS